MNCRNKTGLFSDQHEEMWQRHGNLAKWLTNLQALHLLVLSPSGGWFGQPMIRARVHVRHEVNEFRQR